MSSTSGGTSARPYPGGRSMVCRILSGRLLGDDGGGVHDVAGSLDGKPNWHVSVVHFQQIETRFGHRQRALDHIAV